MSCDCNTYINCKQKTIQVATSDRTGNFGHTYASSVTSDDVMGHYLQTNRAFSAKWATNANTIPGHIVICNDPSTWLTCGREENVTASSSCSESCIVEKNIPYFWDRQRDIYIWKNIKENLTFEINSNKTARFRMKWGVEHFHKILIPVGTVCHGTETFMLLLNGRQKTLACKEYSYDPFPSATSDSTWGLYGNTINNSEKPETPGVRLILIFPTVPKQAIPLDQDVLYYGFYDYNVIEGGFTESSLAADDGGKDYFYPYWCRSMPSDPIWRETADSRYSVIKNGVHAELPSSEVWTPPDPETYPWPCGSFAKNPSGDINGSCVLRFSQRAGGGVVYNYSTIGDLFAATAKNGPALDGKFSSFYPVTPL